MLTEQNRRRHFRDESRPRRECPFDFLVDRAGDGGRCHDIGDDDIFGFSSPDFARRIERIFYDPIVSCDASQPIDMDFWRSSKIDKFHLHCTNPSFFVCASQDKTTADGAIIQAKILPDFHKVGSGAA